MATDSPRIYRPRYAFQLRAYIGAVVLLVFCLLLIIPAAISGTVVGVVVPALIALAAALFLYTMRRQRVILGDEKLIVQGLIATVRVPLADVTAVHHQDKRGLVTWVAATDVRPFRIYFVTGYDEFVHDVRARAIAAGAQLDLDGPLVAPAPAEARRLFTSF